jgi:hypothetical protein
MELYIAVALELLCISFPAWGMSQKNAINELGGELVECSVFFSIGSTAIATISDSERPGTTELSARFVKFSRQTMEYALQAAIPTGSSAEGIAAHARTLMSSMMDNTHSNYSNMGILNERYLTFCTDLIKKWTDWRVEELIAGKLCTNLYPCK